MAESIIKSPTKLSGNNLLSWGNYGNGEHTLNYDVTGNRLLRLYFGVNGRYGFFDISPSTFGNDDIHVYYIPVENVNAYVTFVAKNKILIANLPANFYLRAMKEYTSVAF